MSRIPIPMIYGAGIGLWISAISSFIVRGVTDIVIIGIMGWGFFIVANILLTIAIAFNND